MSKYLSGSILAAGVLLAAGCESTPVESTQLQEPLERCDTILTGSRIPQCNRGDVKVLTREEIGRRGLLFNPAASDADSPLLPGRSH